MVLVWPFHKHQWKVVDVKNVRINYAPEPGGFKPGKDVTQVLRRCECRETKIEELEGTWTKEQVE